MVKSEKSKIIYCRFLGAYWDLTAVVVTSKILHRKYSVSAMGRSHRIALKENQPDFRLNGDHQAAPKSFSWKQKGSSVAEIWTEPATI